MLDEIVSTSMLTYQWYPHHLYFILDNILSASLFFSFPLGYGIRSFITFLQFQYINGSIFLFFFSFSVKHARNLYPWVRGGQTWSIRGKGCQEMIKLFVALMDQTCRLTRTLLYPSIHPLCPILPVENPIWNNSNIHTTLTNICPRWVSNWHLSCNIAGNLT